MSDFLTYFDATFKKGHGQLVQGELRAFLPKYIVLPDGAIVQPHDIVFPLVNGKPTMPDGSPARIIATAVGIPAVRIPFILVDSETGKETRLGDALIPEAGEVVQLSSLLKGVAP